MNIQLKTQGAPNLRTLAKSEPGQVVLVLQGGGALGSYQAGVYQALHEAGIEPDWIIGTSIGAINASLIAGNAPQNRLSRLREFWKKMEQNPVWNFRDIFPGFNEKLSYWSTVTNGIPGFFRPNPLAHAGDSYPLGADNAGYYSTSPLERTLTELVDFNLVNQCTPRLTVGTAIAVAFGHQKMMPPWNDVVDFKVARKAETSSVGRLEINPTVSDKITTRPDGKVTARNVVSSVANSWSAA